MSNIGHNKPPSEFDEIKTHIETLRDEARLWLDGGKVETKEQADKVGKLLGMLRDAAKKAEALGKKEVEPLDLAKAKIQAKYNPLIADTKGVRGITTVCINACKDALAPYLDQQRRLQEQAERAAREEAERKQREAEDAIRAARDLEAKEAAELALQEAKEAEKIANKAAKERPNVAGSSRAIGLRTTYVAELDDLNEAVRHYWVAHKQDFADLVQRLADQDVRHGKRDIPGFKIIEKRTVT